MTAMRMSQLLGRTLREAPAEAETDNYRLLLRAGLVVQLAAGVYSYLPLAWRALRKIEGIIREEMDRSGSQEMRMPVIQPLELVAGNRPRRGLWPRPLPAARPPRPRSGPGPHA